MEEQEQEVAAKKRVRTVGRPGFCYFNNNSTTQPRYFCNIPYGGGTHRRRQSNKSSIPSSSNAVDSMINRSGDGGMESPSVDVMGLGMTHPITMSPPIYYGQDLDTGSTIVQPPFNPQLRFGLNFLPTQPQQPFFPLNPTLIAAPQTMQQLDWLHGFTSTLAAGILNDEEILAVDLHGLLGHQPSPPPPFI